MLERPNPSLEGENKISSLVFTFTVKRRCDGKGIFYLILLLVDVLYRSCCVVRIIIIIIITIITVILLYLRVKVLNIC